MNPILLLVVFSLAAASAVPFNSSAAQARVTVDVNNPGLAVPPTLHGLFFEDINYGADGGLYAELVQNRSFEDREPLYAWSEVTNAGAKGRLTLDKYSGAVHASDRPHAPPDIIIIPVLRQKQALPLLIKRKGY